MSDLRRTILDATVALVAEQGVRAVSFREVARRAGVSHQVPYHHFGNVAGILHAIAEEGFTAQADAMEHAAAAHDDALDALAASGLAYVRFAREHTGHFRVMFQRALVDLAQCAAAERTHGVLVRLSEAAHRAGHGAQLAPEAVTHLCWSTVHGLAFLLIEGTLERKPGELDEDALIVSVVGGLRALLEREPTPQAATSSAKPRRRR